jgi:hypothetical protein
MRITAHPHRIIGELLERGPQSNVIWTPDGERKQAELMRVISVGSKVHEIFDNVRPGDLMLLSPERYGANMTVKDDETGEVQELHVARAEDLLAHVGDIDA